MDGRRGKGGRECLASYPFQIDVRGNDPILYIFQYAVGTTISVPDV
jgi:hypothetical protein